MGAPAKSLERHSATIIVLPVTRPGRPAPVVLSAEDQAALREDQELLATTLERIQDVDAVARIIRRECGVDDGSAVSTARRIADFLLC